MLRAVSERIESVGGFPNRLISRTPSKKPSPSSKPSCAKSPNGPSRVCCAPSKPAPKSSSPRNVQTTSNPAVNRTIQDDRIPLLACALGHKACRENMSVLYTRMPRLFADLAIAHGDTRYARLLRSLARVKLLILDDWGPESLTPDQARDLLEIVEDRYDKGSLVITSQVPVDRWH